MHLKIKRLHPDAVIPKYATAGAACFDIVAIGEAGAFSPSLPLEFFGGATFSTGLSFEVPSGHVMLVFSRSGHGFKHDTRLANCVGVIDSDYRGELLVRLVNDGDEPFIVRKGDRVAQAMLTRVPHLEFVEVDDLSETARGEGGFGSTGA